MNNDIFEDINDNNEEKVPVERKDNSNNNSGKNIIIISAIIAVLIIAIIIICVVALNNNTKNNKDDDIVDKETVLILGKDYVVFDTTELVLDASSLTTNDILNISKLENLKKLDIKNATLDDISFIENLKKLNVIKIKVSTKITDYTVLSKLDNLFTLEIYGGIGKSADMKVFGELDKISTLYLTLSADRDITFLNEMSNLSLLSVDCSIELYNKISELIQNTKIRLETHGALSKTDMSDTNIIEDGIINWSQYDFESTEVISINIDSKYSDINLLQTELNKLSNYTNLKSLTITTDDIAQPYSIDNFNFIKSLVKLESLYIDYLNANDISAIGNLKNLKILSLTNGNMANSKFSVLSNLTNLETLNLSMQNITDIKFLSKLTKLTKLYLSGNNITNIDSLKNLSKLTELYIGCNKNLKKYDSLKSLKELNILMITPDTIDIKIFTELKKLKNLYVGVTFDKIEEFKKTYPDINIESVSECV